MRSFSKSNDGNNMSVLLVSNFPLCYFFSHKVISYKFYINVLLIAHKTEIYVSLCLEIMYTYFIIYYEFIDRVFYHLHMNNYFKIQVCFSLHTCVILFCFIALGPLEWI